MLLTQKSKDRSLPQSLNIQTVTENTRAMVWFDPQIRLQNETKSSKKQNQHCRNRRNKALICNKGKSFKARERRKVILVFKSKMIYRVT